MTTRKPTAAPPVSPRRAGGEGAGAAEMPAQPPAPAIIRRRRRRLHRQDEGARAPGADRGRLVFAMDATMSRAPTWDMALELQGDMFDAVKEVGGLDVQLVYFRGMGECRASKWVSDPAALARLMTSVSCHGGLTQIGKVLTHALDETKQRKVNALVYVGDAWRRRSTGCARAPASWRCLACRYSCSRRATTAPRNGLPEIARLTKGAYCRFDRGSATQLRELLTAVAVYAAGGRKALRP